MAEQAFQLKPEARYCGTLDAAYAEAGRFEEAIEKAQRARELALATGEREVAADAEKRLELYRLKQPYRQKLATAPQGGGAQ